MNHRIEKIVPPPSASRPEGPDPGKPFAGQPAGDRSATRSPGFSAALFCIVLSALFALAWPAIRHANIEAADFAANSLLIQDAKHLRLWVGNYSRIGFNHPGPAILYVLAAGEWLFYDVSNIVASPFSGQIVAVVIWQAAWIVALARLFGRILESRPAVVLAIVAFLFATVLLDPPFLTGMWFPHLYYLPFAVAVLSLSRLAAGSLDSLLSLSVSSGFLFNGHVSFVAMLAVMLLGALAYHGLTHVVSGTRAIWDRATLTTHARALFAAFAIHILFWVPLVVMTIAHFPGPVSEYLAFSGGHERHAFGESIAFAVGYWQGAAAAALGLLLLTLIATVGLASYRAFVAMIGVTTLAIVVYARFGIDSLEWRYLGLFYCAAPALTVAIAAGHLARIGIGNAWTVTIATAFVVGTTTVALASPPPEYLRYYDKPFLRGLFETLRTVPHDGRLVVELSRFGDWSETWATVVGLQAYGLRQGIDLICIDQNWSLSNTKAARCTASELAFGTRILAAAVDAPPTAEPRAFAVATSAGVDFYAVPFPDLMGPGTYDVERHAIHYRSYLLGPGWLPIEGQSVSMAGNQAKLSIPLRSRFTGSVELEVDAALDEGSMQRLTVYREKAVVARASFELDHDRQRLIVPIVDAGPGSVDFRLVLDEPRVGMAEPGRRRTGIALRSVRLAAGESNQDDRSAKQVQP